MVRGETVHVRTCPGQVRNVGFILGEHGHVLCKMCTLLYDDNFVPFFFQGEEKSLLYSLTSTRLKLLGKSQEKEEL